MNERVGFEDPASIVSFITAESRSSQLDVGYHVAREPLRERVYNKCAYCERGLEDSYPIDHFRPRRPRQKGEGQHIGYWWLTWSWSNLLPSCGDCNGRMGTELPVEGRRLCMWSNEYQTERLMVLDPSIDDPQDHLQFVQEANEGRWVVLEKKESAKGGNTVRLLKLDKPGNRYDCHVDFLKDVVVDLKDAAGRGQDELRDLWRRKTAVLVASPNSQFRMLAHFYLAKYCADLMRDHGLSLPSLCDDRPPSPVEPLFPDELRFAGLSEEIELRLRANSETATLIVDLVASSPRSLEELTRLFDLEPRTLKNHLNALVKAGKIEWSDGIAHPGKP